MTSIADARRDVHHFAGMVDGDVEKWLLLGIFDCGKINCWPGLFTDTARIMKLSKNNPIIRWTRWFILRKHAQKFIPYFMRYGGWLLFIVYQLIGFKVLLLTTTGRKTGKARTHPLLFINQGQDYIISAHQAGHNRHPHWYLNLKANPQVTVEVFWKKREFISTEITDDEEKKSLIAQFPIGFVQAFQEYNPQPFPVIRLEPIAHHIVGT